MQHVEGQICIEPEAAHDYYLWAQLSRRESVFGPIPSDEDSLKLISEPIKLRQDTVNAIEYRIIESAINGTTTKLSYQGVAIETKQR